MPDGEFSIEDPGTADVGRLLQRHLVWAAAQTPPEDVHALDENGLMDPSVTLYGFRRHGELLAVGALKRIDAQHAELKSMHTAQPVRGQGIGRAMLQHLIAVARQSGYSRLSLETGSMDSFLAARSLYDAAGFEPCKPFGDYRPSRNSTFMTLRLGS
ncbi:MAG: GNAT family N-acetyltransferase [Solirubrobacteraceae bacterium]